MATKKTKSEKERKSDDTTARAPRAGVGAKRAVTARTRTAPRLRTSHGSASDVGRDGPRPRTRAISVDRGPSPKPRGAAPRRTPLAAPKRTAAKGDVAAARQAAESGPSTKARELALALAEAAIDKKAVGIEILDVTGKVDYADFLVVMTGRSDRHVHAIATGIEEAMRHKKHAPLSMEGLASATWVLIDFADVVVHVFQEDARSLYDIEGLWIDAGRVPVPPEDASKSPSGPSL